MAGQMEEQQAGQEVGLMGAQKAVAQQVAKTVAPTVVWMVG
jgi:hypothetical protein